MTKLNARFLAVLGLSGILLACSAVDERRMAYKKAESLPALDVPPDLLTVDVSDGLAVATAPLAGSATLSEYSRGKEGAGASVAVAAAAASSVAKESVGVVDTDSVKLERDGAQRWLVVKTDAATLWPKLQTFFKDNGLPIKRDDPRLGILETDWAENVGAVPLTSVWDKAFSALRSASMRDQYVVRIEPGRDAGTSHIFVVHRGMQQVAQGESVKWLPRESDRWLEAELMGRMALALGGQEAVAKQIVAEAPTVQSIAEIKRGDNTSVWLEVGLDFPRAWSRLAAAVSRTNIVIEDFDRQKGLFYVAGVLPQDIDPNAGWWARTFRGYVEEDPKEFKIKLEGTDAPTRATILTKDGEPDYSKRAELLLDNLKTQLQ